MDSYEIVRKKSYYEVLKNGFRIATCDFPNECEAEIESDKQETILKNRILAEQEIKEFELNPIYVDTDSDSDTLKKFINYSQYRKDNDVKTYL